MMCKCVWVSIVFIVLNKTTIKKVRPHLQTKNKLHYFTSITELDFYSYKTVDCDPFVCTTHIISWFSSS